MRKRSAVVKPLRPGHVKKKPLARNSALQGSPTGRAWRQRAAGISKPEALRHKLLKQQPHSRILLDRLTARFGERVRYGAFAPIEGCHCAACCVTIAAKPLQQAKTGGFINCASCLRFLYVESA